MKAKLLQSNFLELTLIFAIVIVVVSGFAQTWTQTGAPGASGGYEALAVSADGKRIMVITSTAPPMLSADSGVTWATNAIFNAFNRIASSADGTKWIAVFYSGSQHLYVSTNSGNSWNQTTSPVSTAWNAVASSADGRRLFAAIKNGLIYASTNSGTNWTATSAPGKAWIGLALSADGTKLAAAAQNDRIYVSTDMGTTWTTNAQSDSWASIASTASGTRLIASSGSGTYLSTNSGGLWSLVSTNSGQVASSADGQKLVIAGNSIYTSSDSGTTWVSNNAPVSSILPGFMPAVASSADGCKLYALRGIDASLNVWTYQTAPSPDLNISNATSSQVLFSWLLPSTNFVLQQNFDLNTANWVALTNLPTLNTSNLCEEVFLSPTNAGNFFRLIAQ